MKSYVASQTQPSTCGSIDQKYQQNHTFGTYTVGLLTSAWRRGHSLRIPSCLFSVLLLTHLLTYLQWQHRLITELSSNRVVNNLSTVKSYSVNAKGKTTWAVYIYTLRQDLGMHLAWGQKVKWQGHRVMKCAAASGVERLWGTLVLQ